jgi:non-specific serine/threonine protein kinase
MLHNLGYTALALNDDHRAEGVFAEALRIARGLRDQMGICAMLVGMAAVAVARGEAERAARLFGAGDEARRAGGYVRERVDEAAIQHYLAASRAALDEEVFRKAWEQGRAMLLEEAIEFALKEDAFSVATARERGPRN